ncbi:SigB/SigF/SigG family RNA polymerase sigma factor [Actinacidiphila acidipaludis]|uniref:SigB/SigF/SigG family RNA polymerase sigma factor n=1 Tax=Actinacidiphila acidipaludis TaxID=2873382 RepID=A0ABS7Q977_9ACTN|nr:SigB/SigF/SigG family RNA polymerase sigma factor [Streptomyces acidipaludis]MBY8879710.1 SigB/SigF/SigG family RNA polymerase sigma factor [Streptomyces acidipaludis]
MASARTAASDTRHASPGHGPGAHDEPAGADDLFRRMAASRGAEREALRQELVMAWMPMARRLARRYRDRGEFAEDLEQVAALGLIKAVDGFDPGYGHAFATYAVPTIDGELKRHFRDYTWAVHVPRSVKEKRAKVRTAIQQMETGVSKGTPAASDLAARTGLPEADVHTALCAMTSYTPLSLDAPAGGGREQTIAETTGASDPALDAVIDREATKPQLRALPDREAAVLFLRFFRDMKQREIADALGLSQMHVSRLLRATCEEIRRTILENSAPV